MKIKNVAKDIAERTGMSYQEVMEIPIVKLAEILKENGIDINTLRGDDK